MTSVHAVKNICSTYTYTSGSVQTLWYCCSRCSLALSIGTRLRVSAYRKRFALQRALRLVRWPALLETSASRWPTTRYVGQPIAIGSPITRAPRSKALVAQHAHLDMFDSWSFCCNNYITKTLPVIGIVRHSTGLTLQDHIHDRRLSLFGHIARLDPEVPAHDALRLMVDTYEGRKPIASWKWPPGCPRNQRRRN